MVIDSAVIPCTGEGEENPGLFVVSVRSSVFVTAFDVQPIVIWRRASDQLVRSLRLNSMKTA